MEYDAFGAAVSRTGTTNTQAGFAGSWGYQTDAESEYQLLGHRYYDPATGRFLTRDPIRDGRNWYIYCENNPLKAVDANGLQRIIIVKGALGGQGADDDQDISGYVNDIIGDIKSENPNAEIVIVNTADEAYEVAARNSKETDELVWIGHSDCNRSNDGNGLYGSDGVSLDPFVLSKARKGKRFRKISLIGCHSLSDTQYSEAWSRLANGNLLGTYYSLNVKWYAWGIKVPGSSSLTEFTSGRKRVGGGMKKPKKRPKYVR